MTLNGENIFGLEGFMDLIDQRAVDIIHPDMLTSGGILETKLIADRAARNGISTCIHNASSPVGVMAAVHCAATMSNFDSLECHSEHIPWWDDLVTGVEKPIVSNGHIKVPDRPGLGVELNEDVVKEHLRYPGYFEPTPEFDKPIIGSSRGGPYPHIGVDGTLVNNRE